MTDRVGPERRAIERLQDDVAESESRIEDLERALEDSEWVCGRYREALVRIEQVAAMGRVRRMNPDHALEKIGSVFLEAIWTKVEDR